MRLPARPFVTVSVSLALAVAWVALYSQLRRCSLVFRPLTRAWCFVTKSP